MLKQLRRLAPAAAVLVSAALASAVSPARAEAPVGGDSGGKIGIGPLGPASLPADLRIKLEDAAAAGLTASGARVVTASELSRAREAAALGACIDPACERRLARSTDTRTWLRGSCQLDTSTYRIHLELVDAESGEVLAARDDTCDICTESDAADLVNVAASALKTKLTRTRLSVAMAPTGDPALAAVPSPGGAPTTDGAKGPAWRRVLPWVAFAGAAAAIAGGAYYLSLNGDATRCQKKADLTYEADPCFRFYDTLWQGLPLLGVGAALAATGIIVLRLPAPASGADAGANPVNTASSRGASARLVLSPRGVGVAGSF